MSKLNINLLNSTMVSSGFNQAKLAEHLNVSREIVSQWLKGLKFPRPDKLLMLGVQLGLSYDKLVIEEESQNAPVIAFRKKGNRITKPEHILRAKEMGLLLEKLVPFIPSCKISKFERPATLKRPIVDYNYMSELCSCIRREMGVKDTDRIEFEQIINKINKLNAILIPVLWGEKHHHENALHIYLPESMTAWIYINLDTNIHDFKFWMAHELGHVYSPELREDEAEEFADLFAQVLLFPPKLAEEAYNGLKQLKSNSAKIEKAIAIAKNHIISPYTVVTATNAFARNKQFDEINFGDKYYASITSFNKQYKPVCETIFKTQKPSAKDYLVEAEKRFKTPFFSALGKYIKINPSDAFIQNILQMPIMDSKALIREL